MRRIRRLPTYFPVSFSSLPLLFRLAILIFCFGLAACASRSAPPEQPAASAQPDEPGSVVVATARSQIGTPYMHGGCSPSEGYDCSGLVWWTFKQNGIDVPRTSHEQWGFGRFVAPNDRKPGDVVVFRTGYRVKDLHVGIYTERGTFVHSPKFGDSVREEPISVPYWQSRYLGAKRYLPDPTPEPTPEPSPAPAAPTSASAP